MVRLPGLSAGVGVPAQALGRVHSVFDRACNIALHDGHWLTLLGSTLPNAPAAIRVDLVGGFQNWFRPGQSFSLKAGVWRTEACYGECTQLEICAPAPVLRPLAAHLIAQNLLLLEADLAAWNGSHPEGVLTPQLAALTHSLGRAILERDTTALGALARQLLGNGRGLTPSGDDILTACLAGLWRLSVLHQDFAELLTALNTEIEPLLDRTSDLSQHYLRLAMGNLFVEPLDTLREACLSNPDADSLHAACVRALRLGSSSGAEGVAGLLATYRAGLAL